MKKSIVFILFFVLVVSGLFTGCETLDNIGDKVTGIFKDEKKSTDSKEGVEKITKKTDASVTKIAGKSTAYKTPASYSEAYSYRTDIADKTIQTYIKTKTVDALRNTNPDEYVKTVVAKINETATNDFERVKMVHDAICLLISYDAKNFWANTVPDQSWQNVVKTKTAVCEGYANLFQKFCSELKIKSQKISGYARGVGADISTESRLNSNHAWNIVCISDCWYLVDCTWDSGYMNGKSSVQSYTTDWLFLNPQHFVYTHFPSDSKNQLIQPPLSETEFFALPDFRPKLFELSGDSFNKLKKTNVSDDFYEFEYKVKDGYEFTYRVNAVNGAELKNRLFTENEGNSLITRINFPNAGSYLVTVYYMKEKARSGQSCGQFMIQAFSGNDIQYPTIYSVASKGTRLIAPKQSPLKSGDTLTFEVYCEDRAFVAVIAGKNFIQLENDGTGTFTGEVEIPSGVKQISIGLAKSEKGSYETLAVFAVN